jgi:hypothetical protein
MRTILLPAACRERLPASTSHSTSASTYLREPQRICRVCSSCKQCRPTALAVACLPCSSVIICRAPGHLTQTQLYNTLPVGFWSAGSCTWANLAGTDPRMKHHSSGHHHVCINRQQYTVCCRDPRVMTAEGRRGEQDMFAFHTLAGLLQVLPAASCPAILAWAINTLCAWLAPVCTEAQHLCVSIYQQQQLSRAKRRPRLPPCTHACELQGPRALQARTSALSSASILASMQCISAAFENR